MLFHYMQWRDGHTGLQKIRSGNQFATNTTTYHMRMIKLLFLTVAPKKTGCNWDQIPKRLYVWLRYHDNKQSVVFNTLYAKSVTYKYSHKEACRITTAGNDTYQISTVGSSQTDTHALILPKTRVNANIQIRVISHQSKDNFVSHYHRQNICFVLDNGNITYPQYSPATFGSSTYSKYSITGGTKLYIAMPVLLSPNLVCMVY